MLKLFEMSPRLALIRFSSYVDFCKLLAFEAKVELTKPNPVQASSRPAESWCTLPQVCGLCMQQKVWSMAQDKQNCIKCALSK